MLSQQSRHWLGITLFRRAQTLEKTVDHFDKRPSLDRDPSFESHNISDVPNKFKSVVKAFDKKEALLLAKLLLEKDLQGDVAQKLSFGVPLYGSFHILFPVIADGVPRILFKVPSNGVGEMWTEESGEALRSEAQTMAYLIGTTTDEDGKPKLPIPRVFAFSATVNNSLCCAYMAISYIDGLSLHAVWYGHLTNPAQFDIKGALARQQRTLECIVDIQAQLGKHTSKQGGTLRFSPYPTVDGHAFVIGSPPARIIGIGPGRMPDVEKMLEMAVESSDDEASEGLSEPENHTEVDGNIIPSFSDKALDGADIFVEKPSAVRRLLRSSWAPSSRVLSTFRKYLCFNTSASRAEPGKGAGAGSIVNTANARNVRREPALGSSASSQDSVENQYFTWGPLDDMFPYITSPLDVNPPTHPYQEGVHKLLRLLISWVPDMFSGEDDNGMDRFVLAHPDLNMQNIIVDRDGTVLGLIDWDNVAAIPRAFGNETLPSFLTRDWDPNVYKFTSSMRQPSRASSSHSSRMREDSPEALKELRRKYLQLMNKKQQKVCPFTSKYRELCVQSAVVENIFLAAYDPLSRIQIMAKVIAQAWVVYLRATGLDLTEFDAYFLVQQINAKTLERHVLEQLEKAFHELLKAPDA